MSLQQVSETELEEPVVDGRRRRTIDSRARIIRAMLDLTQAGNLSVSAELVAERANVGLRTVFRHFRDMDSLYREMSQEIRRRINHDADQPFAAADWRGRLLEMIARRSAVFEFIAPFKRAEAAHRHRSRFLEQDVERLNGLLRERLRETLPPVLAEDRALFEALDLLLSFEAWERLRRDQNLGPRQARDILENAIDRLVTGAEAPEDGPQVTAARTP